MEPKYHRVLIKLSGEALAGSNGFGLNPQILANVSQRIKKIYDLGVEIAIVVGGGNFWRGRYSDDLNKSAADYMGMLATVINAMALQDSFEKVGMPARVQSALKIDKVCEPFILRKAIKHLDKKRIVIFAGGTGNPFFTTDTAASLRAIEIGAQILLLAKNVDAVYDSDPNINKDAKKFNKLTYSEIIDRDLKVMDLTAVTLCKENDLPIQVFGLNDSDNLIKAIYGESVGTYID